MTRSQARTSNSVSLFPFLAVLVCAMGALIFLLLITTRRIRQDAVIRAITAVEENLDRSPVIPKSAEDEPDFMRFSAVEAPVPQANEPKPIDPNVTLRDLIAILSSRRDERQYRLDERQALARAAETRLVQTESRLQAIRNSLRQTQEQKRTTGVNRQIVRTEFARLEKQIEETKRQTVQIRQQNATQSSKFVIVPFDGQSGTTRRPILIECTKDGLNFLQEDILLTAADLDGFTTSYNPMLAGTSALVDYWKRQRRAGGDVTSHPEPYVLLIVRPSGSIAYYAARKMLSQLGQPIGYELLQADQELDIPPSDAGWTDVCRDAIQQVLAQRQRIIEEIIGSGKGGGQLFRFRRGPSGIEPIEPERSLLDRRPSLNNRYRYRTGKTGSANGGSAGTGWLTGVGGNREAASTLNPGGRTGGEPGGGGSRGTGSHGAGKRNDRGNSVASPPSLTGPSDGTSTSGFPYPGRRDGNGKPTQTGERRIGDGSGLQPGGNDRRGDHFAGTTEPRSSGEPGSETNPNSGNASGGPDLQGTGRNTSQSGTRSQSSQQGGPSGRGGPSGKRSRQRPSLFPTFGQSSAFGGGNSNPRRRRAWGIGSMRNGIGFERETVVRVTLSWIQVGNQPVFRLNTIANTEQLIERVLVDLDRHARTWGKPPANFYWVPAVRFLVNPGGNQHYERLHGRLRKWGISSTAEYPLDTPSAPKR